MDHVVGRRMQVVHELRERLGQSNAAVSGIHDVADAFVRGQVETLVLDPRSAAEIELDVARHPGLALGPAGEGLVRVDQAFVAAATLTSAEVTVAPTAAMGGAPVAALLRWDDDTGLGRR
jgi:hypothetical protein